MRTIDTSALALLTLFTMMVPAMGISRTDTDGDRAARTAGSHYASVNGLRMYYEIHGTGRPLVLLHGAFSTVETDFGKVMPSFAKSRQVIAIEQQGHGHTGDIDRPLSYAAMADDVAELLRQLGIESADFLGYSMGGCIAMHVARRHPGLVGKVVFAGGTSFNREGLYPGLVEGLANMPLEALDGTPWQQAYARVAPNPKDWHTLVAKKKAMDLAFTGWSREEVRGIRAPMMLMIGDADIVRPEHTVEMFRLLGGGVVGDMVGLPNSRLAVLPGTTHVTLVERTDWLYSMVMAFLEAPVKAG